MSAVFALTAIDIDAVCSPPIAALAKLGHLVEFPAKKNIVHEGDAGDSLFVVLAGRVRIFVDSDDERRFVIGLLGAGSLFGEGSLDGGPRTASVEAVTATTCAVIAYADLRQRLSSDAHFGMALVMELIQRSRHTARRMKGLALNSAYQRFRELVMQELGQATGALPGDWSQQEIAQRLGCSRDMVTKIFKELSKGDYVLAQRGGALQIMKPLPKAW
jgi:CRP/FNR family cyclic AMP-dependent transcriptional regulator